MCLDFLMLFSTNEWSASELRGVTHFRGKIFSRPTALLSVQPKYLLQVTTADNVMPMIARLCLQCTDQHLLHLLFNLHFIVNRHKCADCVNI
jgi:hypothetical protein